MSGGNPYGIVVPDGRADGVFVGETVMPFVQYLNWTFARGGFPYMTDTSKAVHITDALTEDLLPL